MQNTNMHTELLKCGDASEGIQTGEGDKRSSVVSMPDGSQAVDGRWRERMRERFFSSTGDYVRMHPTSQSPTSPHMN